jgi:gas vesicle protein
MKSGKVILGLLAGIAAGATLGILFAPDKGSSTRKKIAKKSENYLEEMESKFNELIDKLKVESGKEEASRIIQNGKTKMDELENEAVDAANKKMR